MDYQTRRTFKTFSAAGKARWLTIKNYLIDREFNDVYRGTPCRVIGGHVGENGMCEDLEDRTFLRVEIAANERHGSLYLLVTTDGPGGVQTSYVNDEWEIDFDLHSEKREEVPGVNLNPVEWNLALATRGG